MKKNLKFKAIISAIVICIITSTINFQHVDAQISGNLPVSYIDQNFPESYMPYINALKAKHPNWTFNAVHTGLEWDTVLSHETYEVNEGISLVEDIFSAEWKKDGVNKYMDGSYVVASKQGVAYVLDPRNFLCDSGIFQFEALRYVKDVQTVDAVQSVLAATPMGSTYKNQYKYYGEWKTMDKTYAEIIHELSAQVGINPVHIASRIRQENSGNIINGSLINGDYGVYNFYNIGAYDTATADAITNGIAYAKDKGWTDIPSALMGGIRYIYDKYVKWGQNTIYFERFDVNNPGTAQWLLGTGYMTNIFGAKNEASITYNAYSNAGLLESNFVFDIPVYENMPAEPASMPLPEDVSFTPDNTKVYLNDPSDSGVTDEFWIRSGPDTLATIIDKLYETKEGQENRTKFTRIGIGQNTLYDKIQYEDGRIGYMLKNWIYEYKYTKVDSVSLNVTYSDLAVDETLKLQANVSPSNAQDKSVMWKSSDESIATVDNNGNVKALKPGVVTITVTTNDQNKTAICTLNIVSKKVTSITLDNSEYTVKVGKSINIIPTITPNDAINKNYSIEVVDTSVAKVDGKNIVGLKEGATIATFITEDGNHKAQAKIIVKPDDSQVKIEIKEPLIVENNTITKIDLNANSVSDIKKNITTNCDVSFVNIDSKELADTDKIGTGTKIQFKNQDKIIEEYTVVVYGDVDGSGSINARDLLMLQRYLLKKAELQQIQVKAAIVDKVSQEPKAADLLKIQRHILGKYVIEQ